MTANGDVFTVSRGYGELVSEEVYDEIVSEIADKVDREIKTVNGFYDWTAPERNYMAIREQFFRICREFGWTMKGGKL